MARIQRTDITVTIEEWLSKNFWGQVVLWLSDHISEPHFITSLTLWAVKTAARILEPLLLFCAAYLMVSIGIPRLLNPDLHDFSLSVLTGAPDVILPGGFVTVWQKFAKKEYVSASILSALLVAMAVLTGFANADVFGVIKLDPSQITQLLFWRAMTGMAYSTTIIITLLTGRHAQEAMTLAELQQAASSLRDQLESEEQQTSDLRTEIEGHQHRAAILQKQLGSAQQEASRLQQDLVDSQRRLSVLQEELAAGQGDSTTLRKQLNTALIDIDAMRVQLESKEREVASLKETLTGSNEMQQSRVQQLLADEQKQAERLRQQLEDEQTKTSGLYRELQEAKVQVSVLTTEQQRAASLQQQLGAEQEGVLTLRQQLHTTNLQVIDLTGKLETANLQIANLQEADGLVADLSTKLDQKNKELAVISNHMQSADLTITNLQQVEKLAEDLATKLQEKEQDCERAKGRISQLTAKLRETGTLSQGNITSIDQARVKVKASDVEVLTYMKEHPTLKVPEIADHFGVTPRTIYNILKRQETGENSESEAVGEV